MSRTIEIVVRPNGQSRIETKGFLGSQCRRASQFIERALGKQQSERLLAEFHQPVGSQQTHHQTN